MDKCVDVVYRWFLTLKDREAIVVSILALAVSIFGIYLNLRVVYDANIRILSFDVNFHSEEQLANTKLAFFNGGNAPYLVNEIQLLVGQDDTGEGYFIPDDGVPVAGTLPFVLDKGKIKLVEMKRRGASVVKDAEGVDEQYYGMKISSVDIGGAPHESIIWYGRACRRDGRVFSAETNSYVISMSSTTTEKFESFRKKNCSD